MFFKSVNLFNRFKKCKFLAAKGTNKIYFTMGESKKKYYRRKNKTRPHYMRYQPIYPKFFKFNILICCFHVYSKYSLFSIFQFFFCSGQQYLFYFTIDLSMYILFLSQFYMFIFYKKKKKKLFFIKCCSLVVTLTHFCFCYNSMI
jgi:hypothetical protein